MSLKDKILQYLENNRGTTVSGAHLATEFGVSRAAVWKAIAKLRTEDVDILAEMGGGYRLVENEDSFTTAGVQSLLRTNVIGQEMKIVQQITSTNTVMKQEFAQTAPHGFVLAAAEQTAGRGRMGRTFASPEGSGIYTSVLLRPSVSTDKLHFFTLAAAVAVCQTIEELCDFRPSIKWVNDVLMDGKKLCGILTEAAIEGESGALDYVVVGIGVNLDFDAQLHPELADIATGLSQFCTNVPRRAQLLATLLHYLEIWFARLDDGLIEAYRAYLGCLDKPITVLQGATTYTAHSLDVTPQGHLVVRDGNGQLRTLSTGEISIRMQ